jgi:hypothetical protein
MAGTGMADRDLYRPPAPPKPLRAMMAPARGADPARLGIVIVNFKSVDATMECLESLLRLPGNFRVVVVENGSADGSLEALKAWASGARLYKPPEGPLAGLSTPPLPKPLAFVEPAAGDAASGEAARLAFIDSGANLGFAGGNNLGSRWLLGDAGIDRIWYLNNDTVVAPGAVRALLATFEADPKIGMVGTVVRYYHRPETVQALNGMRFSWLTGNGHAIHGGMPVSEPVDPKKVVDRTGFVLGASLAVSRAFYEAVGPMEERYFLYFEEMDWAARNAKRFRIGFARGATVFHKHGGSIGSSSVKGGRSALSEYYMLRSKLAFYWRHGKLLLPLIWLQGWLQIGLRLLRRQPGKALAMGRAMFGLPYGGQA